MNDDERKWLKVGEVCKIFGMHAQTVRKYGDSGKFKIIKTEYGQRLYDKTSIEDFTGQTGKVGGRETFIYCRVSNDKQRDDLQRQIDFCKQTYPNSEVITDIASGINFKRKGLLTLLDRCDRGEVKEIVVAFKDRLCRVGFEFIEWFVRRQDIKITILNDENHKSEQEELAEDLQSILSIFTDRQIGSRNHKNKKDKIEIKSNTKEENK